MFSIPGLIRSLRKRWMVARLKRLLERGRRLTTDARVCRCSICFKLIEPKVRRLQAKTHRLQFKINYLWPGTFRDTPIF